MTNKHVVSVFFNDKHTGYDVFTPYRDEAYKGFHHASEAKQAVLEALEQWSKDHPTIWDQKKEQGGETA